MRESSLNLHGNRLTMPAMDKLELPCFLLCSAPFFSEPVTSGPKISKICV
ncbi:hypothetical protein PAHAL_9G432000 [Panicum hallii]|uniref:Uncharacterized protein n=1 Tax=Panicum hallii TaxID=206008 RepID=A0A2T8I4H2_9POAL|nr:hypothetical protein PAHAL_9G432000 [Panicum hallii]